MGWHVPRVALGTVQFGLDYGVSGGRRVSSGEVESILTEARRLGIDTLDTAVEYGSSECAIGNSGVRGFRIVSKVPAVPDDASDLRGWLLSVVEGSLSRLGLDRLGGLLVHRPGQLREDGGGGLYNELVRLRDEGLVEKVGYSVYSPEDLDRLYTAHPPDLVQVPFNALDRRMETSGWLERLGVDKVEVHVRSVFLQGVLLMPDSRRPEYFRRWDSNLAKWSRWLEESGMTAVQGAMAAVLHEANVDRVVVGVETTGQLQEIAAACSTVAPGVMHDLGVDDLDLIDPRKWPSFARL